MSWLRLDDGFAEHPKIAVLTDREFRIWMRVLCYCARVEDPTIDRTTMRIVPGLTPRFVSKLEALSLLDPIENAWEIHDWIHYIPKDKTGAERQARWRSRRLQQATDPRYATVTQTVTESPENRYKNRDETVTSRAGAHARPVPSVKDGRLALDVAATNGAPPTSETSAAPVTDTYTPEERSLIQAAERWIREEGLALDATRIYRRLVDDFGIKWPAELDRLIRFAEEVAA